MQRVVVLFLALAVPGAPGQAAAQATSIAPADLAATWQLVSLERGLSSEKPERNQQPRGVLILDSAGNVFEWVGTNPRQETDAPANDPVKALADYSGFWGRYRVDTAQKRMVFNARGAVSPNVSAREFSRTAERSGDRLILTSIDEPHSRGGTRWSYERIPPIEAPGPTFRKAVGFWDTSSRNGPRLRARSFPNRSVADRARSSTLPRVTLACIFCRSTRRRRRLRGMCRHQRKRGPQCKGTLAITARSRCTPVRSSTISCRR